MENQFSEKVRKIVTHIFLYPCPEILPVIKECGVHFSKKVCTLVSDLNFVEIIFYNYWTRLGKIS